MRQTRTTALPGLPDAMLLAVWDRGSRSDLLTRALLLASAAPECAQRDPSTLTIGERDALILRMRAATFGSRLCGVAECPRCAERLEFDFDGSALLDVPASPPQREFECANGARFRLPDSRDLRAIADAQDPVEAAEALFRRLRLGAEEVSAPSAALLAEVEAGIAALDAAADLRIGLDCRACGHVWDERLDIAAWFWDELDVRVARLLDDVHLLASAYGWGESQILALGDARRRAYLERCGA